MRLPSNSTATILIRVALIFVPCALAVAILLNYIEVYWFLLGGPAHLTVTTVWAWRILASTAVLLGLIGLVWSLMDRRTGFAVAHAFLLVAVVLVALSFPVPNDPLQLQPRNPMDFVYCHTDGRNDCP